MASRVVAVWESVGGWVLLAHYGVWCWGGDLQISAFVYPSVVDHVQLSWFHLPWLAYTWGCSRDGIRPGFTGPVDSHLVLQG